MNHYKKKIRKKINKRRRKGVIMSHDKIIVNGMMKARTKKERIVNARKDDVDDDEQVREM